MKTSLLPICFFMMLASFSTSRADLYVPAPPVAHEETINSNSAAHAAIRPSSCLVLRRDASVPAPAWKDRRVDLIQKEMVAGSFETPAEGAKIEEPGGQKFVWQTLAANKPGVFDDPDPALNADDSAYRAAFFTVNLDKPQVMILCASCHRLAYVNGQPHFGDVYGWGYSALPVSLRAGKNEIVLDGINGSGFSCALEPAPEDAFFNTADPTLPDPLTGKSEKLLGALVVINARDETAENLEIEAKTESGKRVITTKVPAIPALCIRKAGFSFDVPAIAKAGGEKLIVDLARKNGGHKEILDRETFDLDVRTPLDCRKITFVSKIDGSVQYYALNPASGYGEVKSPSDNWKKEPPALVLSLHGASVEAIGQARAYESKTWANIVCPTNRRPYGFDWENWGRLDALEVLDLAKSTLPYSPDRVYLSGHSMGGHGTWQIGVLYPDKFAAIAPCSGWISFDTYGGKKSADANGALSDLMKRAMLPSETLAMKSNYSQEGIYILHGSADQTVPVDEARKMRDELSAFHHDFVFHEEPGQGHWWDINDEPGADCEDYAPLFDFLSRHRLPDDQSVRQVDFVTPDPGVSSKCHWLSIDSQIRRLEISSADFEYDPGMRRFTGTTKNVAHLSFDLTRLRTPSPVKIVIDAQTIDNIALSEGQNRIDLTKSDSGTWSVARPLSSSGQTPERCGPFGNAFQNRMVFVAGTAGSPEENAWNLQKARFDSESFWYIGNGSVDIVTDKDYLAGNYKDRNVILYGNADTNAAWPKLLVDSPIQVRRGEVQVGSKKFDGDNYFTLFMRSLPGSDIASVAVIAGTGAHADRALDCLSVFAAGTAYPDYVVFSASSSAFPGSSLELAGFYGEDWSLETGDQAQSAP